MVTIPGPKGDTIGHISKDYAGSTLRPFQTVEWDNLLIILEQYRYLLGVDISGIDTA